MEVGSQIWVRDPAHAWVRALLLEKEDIEPESKSEDAIVCRARVQLAGSDKEVDIRSARDAETGELAALKLANVATARGERPGVDDLISLQYLHEPAILDVLEQRFASDVIYTKTGPILLAVNPFAHITGLYSDDVVQRYQDAGLLLSQGIATKSTKLPPHVYEIADAAYQSMMSAIAEAGSHGAATGPSWNQSMLVSGESGAGKTVTCRVVMRYLATISRSEEDGPAAGAEAAEAVPRLAPMGGAGSGAATPTSPLQARGPKVFSPRKQAQRASVERRVLESNPILEAFGNARTLRNENSSRFGKFISLQFDDFGRLTGAKINTYLLERVRLVFQGAGERGYHIFYQAIAGATPEQRERWGLELEPADVPEPSAKAVEAQLQAASANEVAAMKAAGKGKGKKKGGKKSAAAGAGAAAAGGGAADAAEATAEYAINSSGSECGITGFRYTNQSGLYTLSYAADVDELHTTTKAMRVMGFSDEEVEAALETVVGLLHLGNVEFEGTQDTSKVTAGSRPALERAGALLGVPAAELEKVMISKKISVMGDTTTTYFGVGAAADRRDGVVKDAYSAMFDWLVRRINDSIRNETDEVSFIGVLDIFGFESFRVNSFEQLCINFANEKLQQQFNHHIFKLEQAEYKREGIDWSSISFPDNQDCLDLIEGERAPGILALLNEACLAPSGSDKGFASSCYKSLKKAGRFSASSREKAANQFTVRHFAGPVCYTAAGFLDKNRGSANEEAEQLLRATTHEVARAFYAPPPTPAPEAAAASDPAAGSKKKKGKGKGKKGKSGSKLQRTVGQSFKSQLKELLSIIKATRPHYIRCLKPNAKLKPKIFERLGIVEQLRCGGVLEAVRVSRLGYPTRMSHADFWARYSSLLPLLPTLASVQEADASTSIADLWIGGGDAELPPLHAADAGLRSPAPEAAADEDRLQDLGASGAISPGGRQLGGAARGPGGQVSAEQLRLACLAFIERTAPALRQPPSAFQVGQTKVFFRKDGHDAIERRRAEVLRESVVAMQRIVRGHLARVLAASRRVAVVRIQCAIRSAHARSVLTQLRREAASVRLQAHTRGYLARLAFLRLRYCVIRVQSMRRGQKARAAVVEMLRRRAAVRLQSIWRAYCVYKPYRQQRASCVRVQCALRGWLARRALERLRREARDLGKLKEDNVALRSRVARLEELLRSGAGADGEGVAAALAEPAIEAPEAVAPSGAASPRKGASADAATSEEVQALRAQVADEAAATAQARVAAVAALLALDNLVQETGDAERQGGGGNGASADRQALDRARALLTERRVLQMLSPNVAPPTSKPDKAAGAPSGNWLSEVEPELQVQASQVLGGKVPPPSPGRAQRSVASGPSSSVLAKAQLASVKADARRKIDAMEHRLFRSQERCVALEARLRLEGVQGRKRWYSGLLSMFSPRPAVQRVTERERRAAAEARRRLHVDDVDQQHDRASRAGRTGRRDSSSFTDSFGHEANSDWVDVHLAAEEQPASSSPDQARQRRGLLGLLRRGAARPGAADARQRGVEGRMHVSQMNSDAYSGDFAESPQLPRSRAASGASAGGEVPARVARHPPQSLAADQDVEGDEGDYGPPPGAGIAIADTPRRGRRFFGTHHQQLRRLEGELEVLRKRNRILLLEREQQTEVAVSSMNKLAAAETKIGELNAAHDRLQAEVRELQALRASNAELMEVADLRTKEAQELRKTIHELTKRVRDNQRKHLRQQSAAQRLSTLQEQLAAAEARAAAAESACAAFPAPDADARPSGQLRERLLAAEAQIKELSNRIDARTSRAEDLGLNPETLLPVRGKGKVPMPAEPPATTPTVVPDTSRVEIESNVGSVAERRQRIQAETEAAVKTAEQSNRVLGGGMAPGRARGAGSAKPKTKNKLRSAGKKAIAAARLARGGGAKASGTPVRMRRSGSTPGPAPSTPTTAGRRPSANAELVVSPLGDRPLGTPEGAKPVASANEEDDKPVAAKGEGAKPAATSAAEEEEDEDEEEEAKPAEEEAKPAAEEAKPAAAEEEEAKPAAEEEEEEEAKPAAEGGDEAKPAVAEEEEATPAEQAVPAHRGSRPMPPPPPTPPHTAPSALPPPPTEAPAPKQPPPPPPGAAAAAAPAPPAPTEPGATSGAEAEEEAHDT